MPNSTLSPRNDLWVFREGKKDVSTADAVRALRQSLEDLSNSCPGERVIPALLRAGELECGVADANSSVLWAAQEITDALALALLGQCDAMPKIPTLLAALHEGDLPARILISPAEGFAYYALHPKDFAQLALNCDVTGNCAVLGIRSIGTTLSAITLAALRSRGCAVERITVRPVGHPYQRQTTFTTQQLEWLKRKHSLPTHFIVTDEGPGRSGSSFLSVGEALEKQGVPISRIKFFGSRPANATELCAPDAAIRWSRFDFLFPTPSSYQRFGGDTYIGGGDWRSQLFALNSHSPECWPQMERLKFLSADRRSFFKFEGLGHFGDLARQRSARIAAAGFSCPPEDGGDGMTCYPVIAGACENARSIAREDLERIAQYCAFRAAEFRITSSVSSQLCEMVRFNVQTEFGVELNINSLNAQKVLADGRMQPHEWIRRRDGVLMKVDASTHGDDHFFPGPTDIAWDLAGAITEWKLDPGGAFFLMERYDALSGDNVRQRIQAYLLAYSIFRFAYCLMASGTSMGPEDVVRLRAAAGYYRRVFQNHLRKLRRRED